MFSLWHKVSFEVQIRIQSGCILFVHSTTSLNLVNATASIGWNNWTSHFKFDNLSPFQKLVHLKKLLMVNRMFEPEFFNLFDVHHITMEVPPHLWHWNCSPMQHNRLRNHSQCVGEHSVHIYLNYLEIILWWDEMIVLQFHIFVYFFRCSMRRFNINWDRKQELQC